MITGKGVVGWKADPLPAAQWAMGINRRDGRLVVGGPGGFGLRGRWERRDGVEGYIIEDAFVMSSGPGSSYISSVVERRSFLAFQRII